MPKLELQISASPGHVRTARLVAAALSRRLGLDAVVIDEIKLAVGEACSRAVGVNQAAQASEPIVIQLRDDDDMLEISVADRGESAPPDATDAAAADLLTSAANSPDALDQGDDEINLAPSLGLALIAGLVDDMAVAPRPGSVGTIVTMRWPIVTF
jgi:anti-sigma regulatory factor (Ser/Thr protein kinase)